MTGDVTTVVITRDRWTDLASSLPRHEGAVVVVDNGSTDGTPDRIRSEFPDVHLIALADNQGAVARNIGVAAARTPYVAFADDDSWWAAGALEVAARCLDAHPRLGLLAGRILVGPDDCVDPVSSAMEASGLPTDPDLPGPPVLGFVACGAVVRREAFEEVGGFDPVLGFGGEEDLLAWDLAARGWGLAHVPSVVAHHHPSPARDVEERARRLARNRLLTSVMRRPWPVVAAETRRLVAAGPPGRRGVVDAGPLLGAAVRRRRQLPAPVEHSLRLLET